VQVLKKLTEELPYGSSAPLLGTYPREVKTYIQANTWTQMFILFTATKYKILSTCHMMNGKTNVVYPYNGILCGPKNI
jgi:hypothetical protein